MINKKIAMTAKKYGYIAALALVVLLIYSNVYQNQYVLDDEFLLQKNRYIQTWSHIPEIFSRSTTAGAGGTDSFYRPLQILGYLFVTQWVGFSPEGFHALNILLHLGTAILILLLATRLGFSRLGSFLSVLLWVVHPIHTEAVTYMSATADPLHTFFVVLALYVGGPEYSLKKIVRMVPFFLLALLSKEPAVVLPALTCVCIALKSESIFRWRNYICTWPLWIVAGIYLVLRGTLLDLDKTYQFYETSNAYTENFYYRLLTFFATIPNYLSLIFNPKNLHLERSFPVFTQWFAPVWLGAALITVMFLCLVWEKKSFCRKLGFAFLWAFIAYFPQSGLIVPVNSLFLEHWVYLPSIGFVVVLPSLFDKAKYFFAGLVFVMATHLGYETWLQNRNWENPITFYNYILTVEPKPPARVFNNLGMAYSEQDKNEEALAHYQNAIKTSDLYPQTHHNLALVLLKLGRIDEAKTHLERAIQMNPSFYYSYDVLAQIYTKLGQSEKAQLYQQKYQELTRNL